MAALNVKKQTTKKATKKTAIKGTPIAKIFKATEEFRKKNIDLTFLMK